MSSTLSHSCCTVRFNARFDPQSPESVYKKQYTQVVSASMCNRMYYIFLPQNQIISSLRCLNTAVLKQGCGCHPDKAIPERHPTGSSPKHNYMKCMRKCSGGCIANLS